jgi:threonine/homoserine/homoserine lactone efflux protein
MMPHTAWPIDPSLVLPFLVAAFVMELTPGPNMAWLAMTSAQAGRRAGLTAVAGVTLGLSVYMVAGVFGATEALARAPALFEALRWAGVAYLVFLAWDAWRTPPLGPAQPAPAPALFRRGFVTNLLNPKAALFYVAIVPAFVRPDHAAAATQIFLLGALHLAISITVHCAIVLSAAGVGARIASGGLIDRRLAALVLLGIAVWTAAAGRH